MIELYNIKVTINKELSSIRLDKVLSKKIDKISRSQIKILIQNGNVKKNDEIFSDSSHLVKEGEVYNVKIIQNKITNYKPENIKLDIVYEDEDLIIINKQAGIVTHPAPGNETGTLVQALLNHSANKLSTINYLGEEIPVIEMHSFGSAFDLAVAQFGSSSKTKFYWRGTIYTTEKK